MATDNKRILNVPNLRFPEFAGEWKETTLGAVGDIVGGGTPDTKTESYWNGDIQWFTPSEIKSNYVSKSERTITESGLKKSSAKLLPVGAILITTRATIGEVAIATEECSTNQGFQSLVVKDGNNNIFVANWIKYNKNELVKRAKGSTFAEISKSDLERIPIIIPSNPCEQSKIANLLHSIDDRIATQSQIIKELESLIKGVMQSMVLGDRAGWEKTNLRIILKERREKNDQSHPIYSVAVSKGVINQIEHLGRSFAAKDTTNYNVVRYGDIIYTKSPTGSFPYGIIKQSLVEHPVAVSPLYGVYAPVNIYLGTILHHFLNLYVHPNLEQKKKCIEQMSRQLR